VEQIQLPHANCACLPPGAVQVPTEFRIWWPSPEGYQPAGAVWYYHESAGASHVISRGRRHQLRCSVALFRWQNVLLLVNSCFLVSRLHGACQPYGHQVQCLPLVSTSEGWTGVAYPSTRLRIPSAKVSGLPAEISGVPEAKTASDRQAIKITEYWFESLSARPVPCISGDLPHVKAYYLH